MLAEGVPYQRISTVFVDLFQRAQRDGKLPTELDVDHLASLAQALVSDGARHWAARVYGDRSFGEVVGRDIAALVDGFSRAAPA